MKVTKSHRAWLVEHRGVSPTLTDDELWLSKAHEALAAGALTVEKLAELTSASDEDDPMELLRTTVKDGVQAALGKGPTSRQVFGGPNLKPASAGYKTEKSIGRHVKTGQPVLDERGQEVRAPSELELAKAGSLLKYVAGRSGLAAPLSEHERGLLGETFDRDEWCGKVGSEWLTGIPGSRAKALLDDVTSGGLEVVPVWFDDNIVQFPLLYGELFPFVDLVEVPRGRRIEGASIGNPTLTWGTPDGTPMTPFTTDSLVAALDTPVNPVTCAVEVGRDFLSDAAVDVGRVLVAGIGQSMMTELDRVIASGNGTTEPEGIFTASGVTDVGNPAGGNGAAPQVSDLEALVFGIGKQYRSRSMNCAFVGNDVSYRRARGIATASGYQTRALGMDEQSYRVLEYDWKVVNDVANTKAAFGALRLYRMYRRLGLSIEWTTQGKTLALSNTALLVARGRFGGKVLNGNAFCKQTHGQA